jgi:hypothetical protein
MLLLSALLVSLIRTGGEPPKAAPTPQGTIRVRPLFADDDTNDLDQPVPQIPLGGQHFDDDALDDDDDATLSKEDSDAKNGKGGAVFKRGANRVWGYSPSPTPSPTPPPTPSPTVGDVFGAILTVAPTTAPTPLFIDDAESSDHNNNFCGRTLATKALSWKKYGSNSIYVDIFTTSCNFEVDNPQYVFELVHSSNSVWGSIGTSNLALSTNRMFRLVTHRWAEHTHPLALTHLLE